MRTHESVLLANYEIEQKVETGENWHARKFLHHGKEVMEDRFLAVFCPSGNVNIHVQCNALGSFHETSSITLTREQFDFLQGLNIYNTRPTDGSPNE